MTKLQIKSDRITSFGGIYLVNRLFDHFSLGKVINDTLGLRSTAHNGYQWDEIVKSLFDIYLCGGDHIEDFASLMPCLGQSLAVTFQAAILLGAALRNWQQTISDIRPRVEIHTRSTLNKDRVQFKLNAIDFLGFPASESKDVIVERTAAVSADIEGLAVFLYFLHDFLRT